LQRSCLECADATNSPTPGGWGAATLVTIAAASTAGANFQLKANIRRSPFCSLGAIASVLLRNGLFSVNHDRDRGRDSLIIDRHVDRAAVGAADGGRIERDRAAHV